MICNWTEVYRLWKIYSLQVHVIDSKAIGLSGETL
jgi:hypothetical protein